MAQQQLATQQRDIRALIQSDTVKNQVALALPSYLTPERMLRICVTSVNRNQKLLQCTPESLLASIMTAAQMGIEPDGRNGHLIPFNNKGTMEVQFMADYKGLVAIVRRNPDVEDIYADLVRDKDKFEIKKGLHRDLVHEIDIRAERGEIIGAYAVIQYRGGASSFEFMSKHEIGEIRKRSRAANDGPWVTDFGEMAKKTVIKRLLKLADLSPETHERLSFDNEIPINDRVVEIPRARIDTGKPATASQEQQPQQQAQAENGAEQQAEPPKADNKPGRKKKEKPESLPKEQPTSGYVRPVLEQVRARLGAANKTPEDLFKIAKEQKWATEKQNSLEDLSDETLQTFLEDWGTVLQVMGVPPAPASPPQSDPLFR